MDIPAIGNSACGRYVCTMLDMRLRIPELMERNDSTIRTAYALAKASGGAISMTNAHRLVTTKGRPARVDLKTLDALCDVFGVGPGELLERDTKRPPATPPGKPARTKAKRKAA